MADFFVFLGSFVSSFLKPIFGLLSDSRISSFLGISLLSALVGFFVVRWLYNVFISHPDHIGSSGISSTFNLINTPAKPQGVYSSAYKVNPRNIESKR